MRSRKMITSRPAAPLVLVFALALGGCITDLFWGNDAPVPIRDIPFVQIQFGEAISLPLNTFFRDPDGDRLTFTAWVTPRNLVDVWVSGGTMTLRSKHYGGGTVVVRARDPGGRSAKQEFSVEVGYYIYSPTPPRHPLPWAETLAEPGS